MSGVNSLFFSSQAIVNFQSLPLCVQLDLFTPFSVLSVLSDFIAPSWPNCEIILQFFPGSSLLIYLIKNILYQTFSSDSS